MVCYTREGSPHDVCALLLVLLLVSWARLRQVDTNATSCHPNCLVWKPIGVIRIRFRLSSEIVRRSADMVRCRSEAPDDVRTVSAFCPMRNRMRMTPMGFHIPQLTQPLPDYSEDYGERTCFTPVQLPVRPQSSEEPHGCKVTRNSQRSVCDACFATTVCPCFLCIFFPAVQNV